MGRPKKDLNIKQFEAMAALQMTQSEICEAMDLDRNTINLRCKEHYGKSFGGVIRVFRAQGKANLRRAQYKNAVDRNNVAMQIFLGKNWLGQVDRQEIAPPSNAKFQLAYSVEPKELSDGRTIDTEARQTPETGSTSDPVEGSD